MSKRFIGQEVILKGVTGIIMKHYPESNYVRVRLFPDACYGFNRQANFISNPEYIYEQEMYVFDNELKFVTEDSSMKVS